MSRIFRPAARSARPVSVISTTASAISGIFASVAPYESVISASTPAFVKNRRVSSGYSVCTRTPAGRSSIALHVRVARDREHHADRPRRCLRVVQLGERHHLGRGLLDPVPAGDADVEEARRDVARDLLGPQDGDVDHPRVVDLAAVVDVRIARDREVRVFEELEGGSLERALGEDESQHVGSVSSRRRRTGRRVWRGGAAIRSSRAQ